MPDIFPVIVLIGRPAAGKSEIIDYLKQVADAERQTRFHLGQLVEIDDFVWVWQIFEDDDVREKLGRPRQNSTRDYNFNDPFVWDWLIGRIDLEFEKKMAREPDLLRDHTVLVEFARGGENGFAEALALLSDEILRRAAIVYVNVPFEESLRRNRRRARPGEEDSILHHSLPDRKLETLYRTNDWAKLSHDRAEGTLDVKGHRLPFAVFQNEPEKTDNAATLGPALQETLDRLWTRYLKGI